MLSAFCLSCGFSFQVQFLLHPLHSPCVYSFVCFARFYFAFLFNSFLKGLEASILFPALHVFFRLFNGAYRMLARSQYPEGPATGHLGTGFSWFPCVHKRMLRWFPRLQVATACFSCSSPDLSFLDPQFIFMYTHYNHCHRATAHLQLNILLLL
jgi:hypothetical protein